MRPPKTPPNYDLLMQEIAKDPKRWFDIIDLSSQFKNDNSYLHWDELRRKTPPKGFSNEEWWFALKSQRNASLKKLPLLAKTPSHFKYYATNNVQKMLHEIDSGAGGFIGTPNAISNAQERDRYVMSSLIEEAFTSSQLEGAVSTRQDAKEMIKTGRKPRDNSEQMILNNFKTMKYIQKIKDYDLTPELVFEIHKQVTQGTLDIEEAAGRFRTNKEHVKVYDSEGLILHAPPPCEDLDWRMKVMCLFANDETENEGFLHPVVRAIILHFWLAYDHPFYDGNGRTARALFYWAMLKNGYWLFEFISISSILVKAPARYTRSFLYSESDDNDLNYFINYQTEVINKAIKSLHAYIDRKQKEVQSYKQQIRLMTKLNPRQQVLIIHALKNTQHEYSIASHQSSHGIAYATARSDLLDLEKQQLLTITKRGNAMYFHPHEQLLSKIDDKK